MGLALKNPGFNAANYLTWEAEQVEKHEYVNGEVFAMVGARREQVLVALTVGARLRSHLKGSRCSAYVSDMKLNVAACNAFYYPDVMVSCDERDRRADLALEHPVLLVEVLSATTAAYDRGDKFAAYRRLPSLAELLLVDVARQRCDLYRKGTDGLWVLHPVEPGEALHLASVDLRLGPDALWADVEPADPAEPPEE